MRPNGQRALSLGVTALAVTMTGSLLSDAGAVAPVPDPDHRPARKLLKKMSLHGTDSAVVDNLGGIGDDRPNIVWIMADDLREDEFQRKWMRRTRNLIARKGVRFQNSFAPSPLCAPARASFLTGEYTHNHRVRSHKSPYGFRSFRDRNTLPVWLRKAGYNTIYLGKYINGYGRQKLRDGRPSVRYIPPGWTDWRASLDSHGTYNYYGTSLNRNGKRQSLAGKYQTNAYGRIGANIIRRYAGREKPFFFNLSFTAPHKGGPREPDDPRGVRTPARDIRTIGKFDRQTRRLPDPEGEPGNRRKPAIVSKRPELTKRDRRGSKRVYRQRAEALSSVDKQVGRLFRTLRRTGELSNTYVIFTSDNGFLLGQARRVQGKTLPYESSLATPLAIRGPGIPRGRVRKDPFTSIDFAPTIAQMAGARVGAKVDGRSMLNVARRGDRGWDRRPVLTNTGARRGTKALGQGIRVKGFLYSEYRTQGRKRELYDLRRDPDQLRNLAGRKRYRFTQKRLRVALHDRWHCSGAKCRKPIRKYVR